MNVSLTSGESRCLRKRTGSRLPSPHTTAAFQGHSGELCESVESLFVATGTAVVGLGTELVHLFGFQAGWVSWFVTRDILRLFWAHICFDLVFVF